VSGLLEAWRLRAMTYVDLDAGARLLEDTKSAVFAQRCKAQGDVSVARAEMEVRASTAWADHLKVVVEARTKANRAKIEADYAKAKLMEQAQNRADERQQMRLEMAS
jgi:hypothetical protein